MVDDPFLKGAQTVRDAREAGQRKVAEIRRQMDGEKARLERMVPIVSSRFASRGYRIEVRDGIINEPMHSIDAEYVHAPHIAIFYESKISRGYKGSRPDEIVPSTDSIYSIDSGSYSNNRGYDLVADGSIFEALGGFFERNEPARASHNIEIDRIRQATKKSDWDLHPIVWVALFLIVLFAFMNSR